MSNDMTKPLQEMTVEELRSYAYLAGEVNKDLGHAHPLRWLARQAFDELARRLAELQQDRDECARRAMACEQSEWHERAEKAEAEIERMKPVVDAAQRANQSLFVDWDDLDNLKDKVRQYEEGK